MIAILFTLIWFACTKNTPSIEIWSEDPQTLRTQCETTGSPELQTTCWVQLAALYGRQGQNTEIEGIKACAEIAQIPLSKEHPETQQVWEWECAFRLGEELGAAGDLTVGLKHCAMAGRFSQNCITHSIWRSPTRKGIHSDITASKLWAHAQEQSNVAMGNLQSVSPELQEDALNQLHGVFGLQVYFGSGILNPEPSHLKDVWGASLRTGYAMERVRLATMKKDRWTETEIQTLYENILGEWTDNTHRTGTPHPNPWTLGRYGEARLSPFEKDIPKLTLYGGGKRLVHPTPIVDLQIALIEAFFWYPHTPPAWFLSHINHSEDYIRFTAAKLLCLSNALRSVPSSKLQNETAIRWHVNTCPLLK